MRVRLLSSLIFLPAMLSAEPALIMQLIGCEKPAIISQQALDQAAALPEALKKSEALRKQPEPDRDAMAKLEKTIEITTINGKQIELTCNNFFDVTHPPTMTVKATEHHPVGERLAVSGSQMGAVLDIESLGRGGAVLHPGAAGWPDRLVFRLHFITLQEFSVSNQRTGAKATVSVEGWDRVPISVICTVKKAEECTVATRILTPDGVPARVPLEKGGHFEIQLEPKELSADTDPLSIWWLDHPPG